MSIDIYCDRGACLYQYNIHGRDDVNECPYSPILSSLYTNLNDSSRSILHPLISKRLDRDLSSDDTIRQKHTPLGVTFLVTGPSAPNEEHQIAMCYYCLWPSTNSEDDINDSVGHIICFTHPRDVDEHGFDLFRPSLDRHASCIMSNLHSDPNSEQYKTLLDCWGDVVLDGFLRVLKALPGRNLAAFVHCVMRSRKLIVCGDKDLASDARAFAEACSMGSLMHVTIAGQPQQGCYAGNTADLFEYVGEAKEGLVAVGGGIVTTLRKNNCSSVIPIESNNFCQCWADTLIQHSVDVDGDRPSVFLIRRMIENFKLRVIHDVNTAKRLLQAATISHYDLFRTYRFLLECGNGPVVMNGAISEVRDAAESDIGLREVLVVIKAFLQEQAHNQVL